jgi:hypothetical protein
MKIIASNLLPLWLVAGINVLQVASSKREFPRRLPGAIKMATSESYQDNINLSSGENRKFKAIKRTGMDRMVEM